MRHGAREWLRGPANQEPDAHDFNRALVVYHRTADRSRVRKRAAETYYKVRQEVGAEWSANYEPPKMEVLGEIAQQAVEELLAEEVV